MRPPPSRPSLNAVQTLAVASRASCVASDAVLATAIDGVAYAAELRVVSVALRLRVSADAAARAASRAART